MLLDLHPAAAVQAGFFDQPDTDRRVTLMRTLDRLNLRFGRDTMTLPPPLLNMDADEYWTDQG